jgi:hypothetical protein
MLSNIFGCRSVPPMQPHNSHTSHTSHISRTMLSDYHTKSTLEDALQENENRG